MSDAHPPTTPDSPPTVPVSASVVTSADTLTIHRQCVKCGYDLFGLHTSGPCTECGTPIAQTLAIETLSQLPLNKYTNWRAGLLFLLMTAGLCLSIVPFMIFVSTVSGNAGSAGPLVLAAVSLIAFLGYFVGCVFASSDVLVPGWARGGLLLGLAVATVCMIMVVVLGAGMNGNSKDVIAMGLVLLVQSVCNYFHFISLGQTLEAISIRAGRDGVRRMCSRFKWYTIIWHGLEFLLVLGLIITIMTSESDRMMELAVAWFLSFIGHAAWVITGLVVIARLMAAGGRERRFGTAPSST